jgi:hypothetical protein
VRQIDRPVATRAVLALHRDLEAGHGSLLAADPTGLVLGRRIGAERRTRKRARLGRQASREERGPHDAPRLGWAGEAAPRDAAAGRAASVVLVNATKIAGALALRGQYKGNGDRVVRRATLRRGEGTLSDVPGLARREGGASSDRT